MGGEGVEVIGPVEPGRGIEGAPGPFDELEMPVLRNVQGTLEHHVLEEMGKAGLPSLFILGSHRIPEIHTHHRGGLVHRKGDLEAIIQAVPFNSDVQHVDAFLWTGHETFSQCPG